jgi:hypothetical protein
MRKLIVVAMAAVLSAAQALAQQPYAALADRPIKALSADDVANLRAGRGMGMALPAELNRYPGPSHVLENEAALGLSAEQREQVQRQFESMRSEAIALGEQIIARETALDALFRSGRADAGSIDSATAALASLYGQLRAVHLRTHLATRATLTDAQLAAYQGLRGYDRPGAPPAHKH